MFLQTLLRECQEIVSNSVIIFPWKKAWHPFEQTLILYSPKCFVLNLNKIDPVFRGGGRKNVKSLQTDRRTDVLTNEQKRTTGDHIYLISVTPQA